MLYNSIGLRNIIAFIRCPVQNRMENGALALSLVMKQLGRGFFSDFACDSSRGLVPWEKHRFVMRTAMKKVREVVVSSLACLGLLQITPLNVPRATRKRFTSVSFTHTRRDACREELEGRHAKL